jgi:photosystem II stability/assembly factor-like uncharacterized protein
LGAAVVGRGIVIDSRGEIIVLSDRRQGIFRSSDFGRSWTNPLPASQANTFPLQVDPNDAATLWTAGFDPTNGNVAAAWVSHDFGRTWTKAPIPILDPAFRWTPVAVAVQPGTGKVLVGLGRDNLVTFEGVPRIIASEDGGKTWTDSSTGLSGIPVFSIGNSIVFDPTSANIVYASTNGGFGAFRSTDAGASWAVTRPQQDANFFTLATAPPASVLAGGVGASFWISSDQGTTWTRRDEGLEADTVLDVVDDGWGRDGIYAISTGEGLAHSSNGGEQWRRIDPQPGIRATLPLAMAVDRVSLIHPAYVVTRNGGATQVWRTISLGRRWSSLEAPVSSSDGLDFVNLVADPLQAGRLYLLITTTALSNGARSTSLLRSDDYGEHWSNFTIGASGNLPANLCGLVRHCLVADPRQAGTLYAAMQSGLWKSTDAGASWNLLAQLPLGFFGIVGLAVTDAAPVGVYVVTNDVDGHFLIQKSVDGGTTWSTASNIFDGASFSIEGGPDGRLFAYPTFLFGPCFDPHVLQSTDGALKWSKLPANGVFAKFGLGHCPTVMPTASHLYLSDVAGSFLAFGARYRDLAP